MCVCVHGACTMIVVSVRKDLKGVLLLCDILRDTYISSLKFFSYAMEIDLSIMEFTMA